MPTESFIRGIFERVPGIGLPLVLVFKRTANVRQAMAVLLDLEANSGLTIKPDNLVVKIMRESGTYERDADRRVRITLRVGGRPESFMRLADFLESIDLDTEHSLRGLQSGRMKMRESAQTSIADAWIPSSFRGVVADWGLVLVHRLLAEDEFHLLRIELWDKVVIQTYDLDGWSGLMRHGRTWHTSRMASVEMLHQRIIGDIEQYAESPASS